MLKFALMAVAAAAVVAIVFVMLPTGSAVRQEPRLLSSPDAPPATSFVIHDAPPPAAATPDPSATPPNPGSSLDTVMQRLRAGAGTPAAPAAPAPDTPAPDAAATPALPPVVVTPPPAVITPTPAPQWTSVTAQGTRWRMARSGDGYVVSIDLGDGQVADVRVAAAFGNLDTAAINVRIDYLRDTIKQNFSAQSGSYTFARDGSVSIDR